MMQSSSPSPKLEPRFVEVLTCFANGMTLKQIATQRGMSLSSMYVYMNHIYRALGANNPGHAVMLGLRYRIIRLPQEFYCEYQIGNGKGAL